MQSTEQEAREVAERLTRTSRIHQKYIEVEFPQGWDVLPVGPPCYPDQEVDDG
jgi:hypothetical protein